MTYSSFIGDRYSGLCVICNRRTINKKLTGNTKVINTYKRCICYSCARHLDESKIDEYIQKSLKMEHDYIMNRLERLKKNIIKKNSISKI